MAKEVAVGKRAKISEAQQYMLLSVLGASVFLGVAIALISHFVKQIAFNVDVIMAEEQAIAAYSKAIESTGVCIKPSGDVYSDEELKKCDPNSIELSQIPNTLRSNILQEVASNEALESVSKEDDTGCINRSTGKQFTYKELEQNYKDAKGADALNAASQLIKSCSALRVIPDALPAYKNEEALLASLNKLFIISHWDPESLSPSGSSAVSTKGTGLNEMSVSLSVEADSATTLGVLDSIERSIREFDITRATIEWGSNDTLLLRAQASAYYMNKSTIKEETVTIKGDDKK